MITRPTYPNVFLLLLLCCFSVLTSTNSVAETTNGEPLYSMPEEGAPHEGTWLQWPHQYQYGYTYRDSLEGTWVAMTRELVTSETVHLIVYDQVEKERIVRLLEAENIPLKNIDFHIYPTDDVWIRDSGPIFVRDKDHNMVIQDWGFNGWGNKADYHHCDTIPSKIAHTYGTTAINLDSIMVNEGGSVEIDGHGTLMACKSSILNSNRNPGMSQEEAEEIFSTFLGVSNFIWLEGQAGLEITDQHIDGFARFGNAQTIVTMERNDLLDFDVAAADIDKLYRAKNIHGKAYSFLMVPLTQHNVTTSSGKKFAYKGSYINYYIANTKVLVPNYNDPNDAPANAIIQSLYPNRRVVGIDVRNLYENGGMIHCVTQQQPKE